MNKKYLYKNNWNIKTSEDIGEIIPIQWEQFYPGEKIKKIYLKNLTRMITPILPTLDNPKIKIFSFLVPERLLYKKQKGDGKIQKLYIKSGGTGTGFKILDIEREVTDITEDNIKIWDNENIITENDLLKKFGINLKTFDYIKNNQLKLDISYLLAYWKIYESFFKNKKMEKFNYTFLMEKLYEFAGAKPTGAGEEIKQEFWKNQPEDFEEIARFFNRTALINTKNDLINKIKIGNITTTLTNNWEKFKKTLDEYYIKNKQITENINAGTLKDIALKIWNENNNQLTDPELIAYAEWEQTITQITNNAKSTGNALGEVGGMSLTYNERNLVNKEIEIKEKTILLTILVSDYNLNIINSFDYQEWKPTTSATEFNPKIKSPYIELTNLSFLPSKKENTNEHEISLGTYPNFEYLRKKPNIIAGDMIDKFKAWTYSKEADTIHKNGSIGLEQIKIEKKPFKDTLISTEQDAFLLECEFETEYLRLLPTLTELENELIEGK